MPDTDASTPINPERLPDPSPLTTAALLREVAHIRIELASEVKNIDTRFDAMDKAVALVRENLNQVPTELQSQIICLRDVIDEKFNGIGNQFKLNEIALNAALNAAGKAVDRQAENAKAASDKAEAANAKQMDQVRDIVNTSIGGINEKIDIAGNRTTTLEGQVTGLLQSVAQLRAVGPAMPSPAPLPQTNVIPYLMGGVAIILLVIIMIFEVMSRGALR